MLCSNLEMDLKCKPNIAKDVNFLNPVRDCPGAAGARSRGLPGEPCAASSPRSRAAPARGSGSPGAVLVPPLTARLKSMLERTSSRSGLRVYTGTTRDYLMNDDETILHFLYQDHLLSSAAGRPPTTPSKAVKDTSELPLIDTDNFSFHRDGRQQQPRPLPQQPRLPPPAFAARRADSAHRRREFTTSPQRDHRDGQRLRLLEDARSHAAAAEKAKFSFGPPFILNPATKAQALYYDNRIRMYSERRMNLFTEHDGRGSAAQPPTLKLWVPEGTTVEDALVELEVVVLENPQDPQEAAHGGVRRGAGIDEGGLSKEFSSWLWRRFQPGLQDVRALRRDAHLLVSTPRRHESCAQSP